MNKSIKTLMMALSFMPLTVLADSDVTAEIAAQNTPEGWTAVNLPQIDAITSANTFDITSYGASTSSDDNTVAIQAALDAVPSTGGMVVIPAGEWLCGPIIMRSKTVLHLAAGATLKLLPYGTFPKKVNTSSQESYANFIDVRSNATDCIIEGEDKNTSIIDGQGAPWWDRVEYLKSNSGPKFSRGAVIRFTSGSRHLIRNLKIQDAPGTNIGLSNSNKASHCTVHDVIIREPASDDKTDPSHNTDGISIWGQWMNVYNCDIANGDDNVVVDSNGRNVHVWNCKFGTGHGASMGSYTVNLHDILWENIDFDGTDCGFRLKSDRDRSGDVYNITMRNCTMKNVDNPVYIECWYNSSTKPVPSEAASATVTSTTPAFHDILIQNVTSTGTAYNTSAKGYFPIYIYGLPESHVKNVTFDNVKIQAQKGLFLAYADNISFINDCNITNTRDNKHIATEYETTYSGEFYSENTTASSGLEYDKGIWLTTDYIDAAIADGWVLKTTTVSKSNYSVDAEYAPDGISGSGNFYVVKSSGSKDLTFTISDASAITFYVANGGSASTSKPSEVRTCYATVNGSKQTVAALDLAQRGSGTIELDPSVTNKIQLTASGDMVVYGMKVSATASGIERLNSDATSADHSTFNLWGMRVGSGYKGLVIRNGKKYIAK